MLLGFKAAAKLLKQSWVSESFQNYLLVANLN